MFNKMQWRRSNEYTHNDDRRKIDRIHLHNNIRPRKLNPYKSENPKFEGSLNASRLNNKSKNRRLFDGSRSGIKSKNGSRISVQRKGYKTKEDDFLYQVSEKRRNNYLRQLPKSRNKVYHLDEDEKDLLEDSWEENISEGEEDEYSMPVRRRN
jgi:hypothetical protein